MYKSAAQARWKIGMPVNVLLDRGVDLVVQLGCESQQKFIGGFEVVVESPARHFRGRDEVVYGWRIEAPLGKNSQCRGQQPLASIRPAAAARPGAPVGPSRRADVCGPRHPEGECRVAVWRVRAGGHARHVLERLNEELNRAIAEPDIRAWLLVSSNMPAGGSMQSFVDAILREARTTATGR